MVRACIRERDPGLRRQPICERVHLTIESSRRRVKDELRLGSRLARELEHKRVRPSDVARPHDVLAAFDDTRAAGTGRIADDVQNRWEKGARVVRRRECVSHERDRVRRIRADRVSIRMFTTIAFSVAAEAMRQCIDEQPQRDGSRH